MNYRRIETSSQVGALTGYIVRENQLFGMSAFHVLIGSYGVNHPYGVSVRIRDTLNSEWINSGVTYWGFCFAGEGTMGNFGLLEYALFRVNNTLRQIIEPHLNPIHLSAELFNRDDFNHLIGLEVFGYSVINDQRVEGFINSINYTGQQNRYDVEIYLTRGTLEEGDSGMLWKDALGNALLMHIFGNSRFNATKSFSTLMNRILSERFIYEYDNQLIA